MYKVELRSSINFPYSDILQYTCVYKDFMQTKPSDDQLIIITGAAGFIGSCAVKYLNDQGLTNLLLVDDIKKTEKWKKVYDKT